MEAIISFLESISDFVWGPYMLIFLVGTGVYLTFGLRGMTVRRIGYAFKLFIPPITTAKVSPARATPVTQ